ncbi:MAG: TlyA family RNA methyltransferase [Desulfobulbaceae bacterium]|uniref:TlyA family RNA methyltransferase n=1 Tax=Candidatus Desulfatifera sulfidica TaxID=2841691 RepID=A0A8J6N7W8_9BACT|nr:TlyA family RNA methyltransferase [Candidatus Desulfatifera sulfidica]
MNPRLDEILVRRDLAPTLAVAGAMICAGEVFVDGQNVDKAGIRYPDQVKIVVRERIPFVSRGGFKIESGLDAFAFDPTGIVCADIGASSGGFTDCLLQRGAQKVYAVDVAYGQFDWKLRQDARVVLIERFNARNISKKQIPEPLGLAVIDVSFISLTRIIPPLLPLFDREITIIALIKPQFELARHQVPPGGVVLDSELHQVAIDKIKDFGLKLGLKCQGVKTSPIRGPKGNREFLILLRSS